MIPTKSRRGEAGQGLMGRSWRHLAVGCAPGTELSSSPSTGASPVPYLHSSTAQCQEHAAHVGQSRREGIPHSQLWTLLPSYSFWCLVFPPPPPAVWSLNVANGVRQERTKLFCLLTKLKRLPTMHKHKLPQIKASCIAEICAGRDSCWGANKEKSVINSVSFIAGERNNLLGLNSIYAGLLIEIQLVFVLVLCSVLTGLWCVWCSSVRTYSRCLQDTPVPLPENTWGNSQIRNKSGAGTCKNCVCCKVEHPAICRSCYD